MRPEGFEPPTTWFEASGFKPLDSYTDMIIKPNKVVERELILQKVWQVSSIIYKVISTIFLRNVNGILFSNWIGTQWYASSGWVITTTTMVR